MKNKIDIRTLEIFKVVAENNSLTKASVILNISVSAISQTLSDAEEFLGTLLLDRTTRPFSLTPAGKILHIESEAILKKIDLTLSRAINANNTFFRQVNVEIAESLLSLLCPQILKNMKNMAENWRFRGTNNPDIYDKIKRQKIDVGIMDNFSLPYDSPYIVNSLVQEPYVVAVPKHYANKNKNLSIESLVDSELTFVRYALNTTTGQRIESYIMQQKQDIPKGMEFDSSPAQISMIKTGIGWGITTPLCYLQSGANNNEVVLVPLKNQNFYRSMVLVTQTYLGDEFSEKMAYISKRTIGNCLDKLCQDYKWLKKDIIIN